MKKIYLYLFFILQGLNLFGQSDSVYNPQKEEAPRKFGEITTFFVGGGITMGKMNFSGSNNILNSLSFGSTTSYIATAGADISLSKYVDKFFLRFEVSINSFSAEGKGTTKDPGAVSEFDHTYSFQQSNITPAVSINLNVLRQKNIKAYLGLGLGYSFSNYDKHKLTSTARLTGATTSTEKMPVLEDSWAYMLARMGIIIIDKIDIGIAARFASSFVNQLDAKENSSLSYFRIYYRF